MPNTPHLDKVWEPTEHAFFNALNGETELRGALEDAAETIRDDWE
jgi:maltose-binding protein MalE